MLPAGMTTRLKLPLVSVPKVMVPPWPTIAMVIFPIPLLAPIAVAAAAG
jgi:hypothetical protein